MGRSIEVMEAKSPPVITSRAEQSKARKHTKHQRFQTQMEAVVHWNVVIDLDWSPTTPRPVPKAAALPTRWKPCQAAG